ncbi:hypothetical protein [Aeromonas dhakensis]
MPEFNDEAENTMKHIDVSQLTQQFPLLQSLIALEPVSWFGNPPEKLRCS